MNLAAGAPPIFLTKNYINRDVVDAGGVFSVSSMEAIAERILDMDPFAYWQGANADDGVPEVISMDLYDGAAHASRSLDLLALLNINAKSFTVELSDDGGATFHTTYTETGYALGYWIKDLSAAPKTANHIRITLSTTQTANAYKKLGTAVAAGELLQLDQVPMFPIDRGEVDGVIALTMADGSKNLTSIKRSEAGSPFYRAGMTFRFMTQAGLRALQAMRRENPAFLFYPEPGENPDEIFYCWFPATFRIKPTSAYKGAGLDVTINVEEIG